MADGEGVVDRVRTDVDALCRAGPRHVGSEGHAMARHHLRRRLEETGLAPYSGDGYELPYSTGFVNLIAVAPARTPPDAPPLLMAAHYDSVRTTPGADDNAAAVAIALEVAQRLTQRPADRSVIVALFDAEEPPYFHTLDMGSMAFVREQMVEPIDAVLVMDLVGHAIAIPHLREAVGVMGCESHPELAALVARHADTYLPVVSVPHRYMPEMSDHAAFHRAGHPFLFLTCGQWEHYHMPTDVPEALDYDKMARIADLVEALLRDLGSRPPLGRAEPHDTAALDYERLARVIGAEALAGMGVRGPEDVHLALTALVTRVQWG